MNAVAAPGNAALPRSGQVPLSSLRPGAVAVVVSVGRPSGALGGLERRLMEFGFISGERVEVIAEARPGRDPFVVRVGQTTLALRRREAETIQVEPLSAGSQS